MFNVQSRWLRFRKATRHSLVLFVAGFVYIGLGIAYLFAGETVEAIELSTSWVGLTPFAILWMAVGIFAILSAWWPEHTHKWGYAAMTGMASAWAALYTIGVVVKGAPSYQLTSALAWGLLAFMWWIISGLLDPPEES